MGCAIACCTTRSGNMAVPARIAMQHRIGCTAAHRQLTQLHQLSMACTSREIRPFVSEEVSSSTAVPVPLCLRPAEHVQLVSGLLGWRQRVLDNISCVKNAFEAADGGPTSAVLQKEVTWVLDDAVEGFRERQQQQWVPITWQQLHTEVQTAPRRGRSCKSWQVRMRAPVQHLEQLWVLRLQDRVPFQYLIHTAHWRDLVLSVGPGILVPRPETELLIDLAAAAIAANPALASPWADLGTGNGAIAIALAKLLQQQQQRSRTNSSVADHQSPKPQQRSLSKVLAVDLSPTAVAYATANAARCGVQDRVEVLRGSWFEPLEGYKRQLGGILSNPPYIPRVQMEGLQAEVGEHEPWSALDGGSEAGIDSLQVICEGAAEMLIPGGFLGLETAGNEQAYLVKQMLEVQQSQGCAAFADVQVHDDCFGVARFVAATRAQCQQKLYTCGSPTSC